MLCATSPLLLAHMFPPGCGILQTYNEAGIYGVRLFVEGRWRVVVVDDWLPVDESGQLVFCGMGNGCEIWAALFEKAVAKLRGSYESLCSGDTQEALHLLLGGPAWTTQLPRLAPALSLGPAAAAPPLLDATAGEADTAGQWHALI